MTDNDRVGRRAVLASLGIVAVAGCLSDEGSEPGGEETQASDDTDTETDDETDTETTADTESESTEASGESDEASEEDGSDGDDGGGFGDHDASAPLVSIDDAYEWYQNDEARFVDARGLTQYANAHIEGAVPSPAPDGLEDNDPVEEWPKDQRIVTYCGCPHHLSRMRAASLLEDGYEDVQALDEGFQEWRDRDYPLEGDNVQTSPPLRIVSGASAVADAGEMTMAEHEPSGQLEAAPIDDDGAYDLHLRFADVDDASPITIETPSYRVEAPLGDLTNGRITAEGTVEPSE